MFIESHSRAITKTISWRVLATLTTIIIVFLLFGRLDLAAAAGGIEAVAKLVLYFFHERLWNKIRFGKKEVSPFVVWFTGLSGSGKSTLADLLHDRLKKRGYRVERLDGDVVRSVFPQTGFTREDRNEHVRRVGFLASMLEKNGVIVISSFISPYQESRDFVRNLCDHFIEVHVSTSLEECERRDIKGLYQKARKGEITSFTGIDDPYEEPESPEVRVDTEGKSELESLREVEKYLERYLA
jgi:adenylylsulfate kinase